MRRRKTGTSSFFSLRACLLDEVIRVFQLAHQLQDEVLVVVPFEIVEIESTLLREVFEVLAETTRGPQALRNQARRFVERVETDDTGFAELFGAVEGPGSFESFAELLFVLFQAGWGEEVLAVECEFEAEEIEDGFDEAATFGVGEIAKDWNVGPEF